MTDLELAAQRKQRAETADQRFGSLLAAAGEKAGLCPSGQGEKRVAIVAVGGYGRSELSPASDLDVVLVHEDGLDVDELADQIWYPLWDDGVKLDHSVRTVSQARAAAADDLRTALSLLDARHVAGDATLTIQLRAALLADWRRGARNRLPDLRASCEQRADRSGEVSYLSEPDLKEAKGGLRDAVVLRALVASWLVDVPHVRVERARTQLLDVRDVMHQVSGRGTDRLVADLAHDVAAVMGHAGRPELLTEVYGAGRVLAHVADLTWRRVDRLLAAPRPVNRSTGRRPLRRQRDLGRSVPVRGPVLSALAAGVAEHEGEVVLAADARPASDPLLTLRAAHAAASAGLMLSPAACERLAREAPAMPDPWPGQARDLFTGLLGSGPALIRVWESLDQAGAIDALVPGWDRLRCRPPQNPVHRFTVDRHSLETCVHAARNLSAVARPDLLLVAALLHDLGKGLPGDHSLAGEPLAAKMCVRMGMTAADVVTVATLVRHHLLLAETATSRDLDDPATIEEVAAATGDAATLDLLLALTEADANATGPAASSLWRLRLVRTLAARARARLDRGVLPRPQPLAERHQRLAAAQVGVLVEVSRRDDLAADPTAEATGGAEVEIAIGAEDAVGLLAAVAGTFAVARLTVHTASVASVEGRGVSVWQVNGDMPDPAQLRQNITRALHDPVDLEARLASRDATAARARTGSAPSPPHIATVPASTSATVLEVRAHDRPGLLYDICRELSRCGADVRSAHIGTLGPAAVDVFYLAEPGIDGPLSVDRAEEVVTMLRTRLNFQPLGV